MSAEIYVVVDLAVSLPDEAGESWLLDAEKTAADLCFQLRQFCAENELRFLNFRARARSERLLNIP